MAVPDDWEDDLDMVVVEAYLNPIAIKGNFARSNAAAVAAAASLGFISTWTPHGFCGHYRPTQFGLTWMEGKHQ